MINILIGKTCSGKNTIQDKMCEYKNTEKIITYTTRPKRKNEEDGVDYYFISKKEFDDKIKNGFFIEYKQYGNLFYGAPKNFMVDIVEAVCLIENLTLFNGHSLLDNVGKILDIKHLYNIYNEYIDFYNLSYKDHDIDKSIKIITVKKVLILEPNGLYDLLDYIDTFKFNFTKMGISIRDILKSFITITYIKSSYETRKKRYVTRGGTEEEFKERELVDDLKFKMFESAKMFNYLIKN